MRLKDIPYPYFIQQKQLDKASNPENDHNKSPAAKEIEDVDTNPRRPPKKSHSIVLSSEDDDDIPASVSSNVQPPKKIQVGPKKRIFESSEGDQAPGPVQPQKKKVRISSEDTQLPKKKQKKPTRQQKKSKNNCKRENDAGNDSEIEVVENEHESPEKELGMLVP